MKTPTELFKEHFLNETRPTRIFNIISDIDKCKGFELIDAHATIQGFVALMRYKDGNAYEVAIKPAQYSEEFPEYTSKKS